jgi:hypothetical protein
MTVVDVPIAARSLIALVWRLNFGYIDSAAVVSKRNNDAPIVKRIPARLWSEELSGEVKTFFSVADPGEGPLNAPVHRYRLLSISFLVELILDADYLRTLLKLVAVSDNL